MVGQIAAAARLPGCTLEEATPEGETAVYLVNCLEEGPGWPARTEQELDKRLSAKARERGVRLHAVECRSQRCRVVLGFERLEAARALNIDEFWSALQATRQFEGGALSGFEPGPDDRGVIQSIVMNRTKGGWETHKSQYEYRVDRDARLARLRAEPRDEDWATKTEAILRSEYEKELGKDAVVSVECRTKRCELTYRAAAERSASSAPTPKERVAALRRRSALFRFRDLADGCHMHAQSADATASGEELLVHWFTCRR